MKTNVDAIIVGGGLVGSALAFGLQRQGLSTVILDESDIAYRAARGNFGLIWVQSKGVDYPPYAQWTWQSAEIWSELNDEILSVTGDDIGYCRPGGIEIYLSNKEVAGDKERMRRLQNHNPNFNYEMLDHKSLAELLPGLGPDVAGGCYSPADGHVNPLLLLRGLHKSFLTKGGRIDNTGPVISIKPHPNSFTVSTTKNQFSSALLVIAAGLGTQNLAEQVGINIQVYPQLGQLLVTERVKPFLKFPLSLVRQTQEGTVQLGGSKDDVGLNTRTSLASLNMIAKRAFQMFPHLQHARIVRCWGALRTLTQDGYPIYEQSEQYPGAFAAACHSGVTLAAIHTLQLAKNISDGILPSELAPFRAARFSKDSNHA